MKHFPPKKKFKKQFKRFLNLQQNCNNTSLIYGNIGLKLLEYGKISHFRLNALTKLLNFHLQRKGRIWLKTYPMMPKTKKPLEVRMGKGKGKLDHWEIHIKPGLILYEITTSDFKLALNGLVQVQKRLGFKSIIINSNDRL